MVGLGGSYINNRQEANENASNTHTLEKKDAAMVSLAADTLGIDRAECGHTT